MISKNLYSLQNTQPFIFQLICMQLCKCLNCFLKPHNKQLNQYYLLLFFTKKEILKNGSGWPAKNTGRVTGQPIFTLGQKNQVRVEYFSRRVRKFLSVLPCLSKSMNFMKIATITYLHVSPVVSHTINVKPSVWCKEEKKEIKRYNYKFCETIASTSGWPSGLRRQTQVLVL